MINAQIQLTEEQAQALRQLAKRRGVSEADLIQEAIQREVSSQLSANQRAWLEAHEFMLNLKARRDVQSQARDWKREDAYADRLDRYGNHSD